MIKDHTSGESAVEAGTHTETRVSVLKGVSGPSPIVFVSDSMLAQLRKDALVLWDAASWKIKRTLPLESPFGVGRLADGSVVALEAPAALKGQARVVRLRATDAEPQMYEGPLGRPYIYWAHVFADQAADALLLISPNSRYSLQRFQLSTDMKAQLAGETPMGYEDYLSAVSMLPGTVAYFEKSSGMIVRVARPTGRQISALPSGVPPIVHLAPGPAKEQVWASDEAGAVRLLQLADKASVIKQLGAGPGRVFHMQSHGEHLAVLWIDQLPDGTLRDFTLTVHDATGRESMRTVVPHTAQPEQRFVAVGDQAVAIGGSDGLRAWELATGKPLLQ